MSSIIAETSFSEQAFQNRIDRFFKQLKLSNLLQKCNFYKETGVASVTILKELFALVFHGKNLYRTLSVQSQVLSFRKNTTHRFLNSGRFNWERLLKIFTTKLITEVDLLTSDDRKSVLIIDDSLLSRNRSKKGELLSLRSKPSGWPDFSPSASNKSKIKYDRRGDRPFAIGQGHSRQVRSFRQLVYHAPDDCSSQT